MRRAEDLKVGDKVALWTGVGFSYYTVASVGFGRRDRNAVEQRKPPRCVWLTRQWAGKTTKPKRWTVESLQAGMDYAVRMQQERLL